MLRDDYVFTMFYVKFLLKMTVLITVVLYGIVKDTAYNTVRINATSSNEYICGVPIILSCCIWEFLLLIIILDDYRN